MFNLFYEVRIVYGLFEYGQVAFAFALDYFRQYGVIRVQQLKSNKPALLPFRDPLVLHTYPSLSVYGIWNWVLDGTYTIL